MSSVTWSDSKYPSFQSKLWVHDTLGPKHGAVGMQRWGDLNHPSLPTFPTQVVSKQQQQQRCRLQTISRDLLSHWTRGGRMQENQWAASIYCNGLLFGSMGFFLLLITAAVPMQRQHLKLKGNKIPSLQGMKASH